VRNNHTPQLLELIFHFPQQNIYQCIFILAFETFDPGQMIEMEETNYEEFKVEYDKSLENSRKNVKVILFGTLIQFFPKEILLEISEFVL
jgi:hypothetical protein